MSDETTAPKGEAELPATAELELRERITLLEDALAEQRQALQGTVLVGLVIVSALMLLVLARTRSAS